MATKYNNKWVRMARSAKTQMEIKAVLEAIEEAMRGNKNRTMSNDMSEALDILVGMEGSSKSYGDEVPLEWLSEEEQISQ